MSDNLLFLLMSQIALLGDYGSAGYHFKWDGLNISVVGKPPEIDVTVLHPLKGVIKRTFSDGIEVKGWLIALHKKYGKELGKRLYDNITIIG